MTDSASLLHQLWFGALRYLPVVAFAAMSWAVGRRLTRRLAYRSELEAAVISTALGWGSFGLVFFLLATAGLFHAHWLLLVLAGSQLACYRSWVEAPVAVRRWWASQTSRRRTLVATALVIVLLPLFVLPLYPPTTFDSVMFHLPMARSIAQDHSIGFYPDLRYPVFPALQEVLFAGGLLLVNDVTPALLHFAAFVGVALLVYCWGSWVSSARTGLLAALLWLGTLSAVLAGSSPNVDCALTLFVAAAFFCTHRYFRRREIGWLVLAAAFIGFAAGTKYHALFFLGLISLAVLFVTLRHRRYRHLLWYGLVVTTLTLPWYLFIYVESGNPVHPFYSEVFGSDAWSYQFRLTPGPTELPVENAPVSSTLTLLMHLGEQMRTRLVSTPIETLRTTIEVFLHPDTFRGRELSPYYLGAMPFLVLMGLRVRRARYAIGLIIVYFTFLSVTVIDLRYVLPILPLLAVFGVEGVDRLLRRITPFSPRWIASALTIALALPLVHQAHGIGRQQLRRRGPLPVNGAQREHYIQKRLNQYAAVQALNQWHDGEYRLYGLFCENLRYYVEGTLLGDWYGPAQYPLVAPVLTRPAALYQVLSSMDIDYLLVPNLQRWKRKRRGFRTPDPDAMRREFEIVYQSDLSVIYRLRHPDGSAESGP